MSQISFDFEPQNFYLEKDFLLSKENLSAFNFIVNYNSQKLDLPRIFSIFGKKFCGKTYLAKIWQRKLDAEFLDLKNIKNFEIIDYLEPNKAYIIEDIDEITNHNALFHIFNVASEKNCYLMLTSNCSLQNIDYNFSDLSSRLKNVYDIKINDPELEFIKMLLIKHFANMQLKIEDKVVDYLAKNLDRSYEKIMQISKLLQFYCFEEKRKITIPFSAKILKRVN